MNRIIKIVYLLLKNNILMLFFGLFLLSAINGCKLKSTEKCGPSFYIWQNNISLSDKKKQYLQEITSPVLYIKYLEIYNNTYLYTNLHDVSFDSIIPVVRIDNQFLENNESNAERCIKIFDKLNEFHQNHFHKKLSCIQIDCDYSDKNKEVYQLLIDGLKNNFHLNVQITLNLYRVANTVVIPKADKYYIMLYDFHQHDGIKIYNEAAMLFFKKDLIVFPYDHAYVLPVFSRCAIVSNNSYSFNYTISRDDIQYNANIVYEGEDKYFVDNDTKIGEEFLAKNSRIEFQEITIDKLENYTEYIKSIKNKYVSEVVYFSLNESVMKKFPSSELSILK